MRAGAYARRGHSTVLWCAKFNSQVQPCAPPTTWSPSLLVMKASKKLKGRPAAGSHRPEAVANRSSPGECSTLWESLRLTSCN